MNRKTDSNLVLKFSILLLFLNHVISNVIAGASSTPKNLINLYTHSSHDEASNFTAHQLDSNQHRQGNSKLASPNQTPDHGSKAAHAAQQYAKGELLADHPSPFDSKIFSQNPMDFGQMEGRAGLLSTQNCKGRLKLNNTSGVISDGPGLYQLSLQCSWIIDSGKENTTIRIRIHQFSTECNYDYLYIFDGDTVYSPLVAAISGDMRDFSMTFTDGKILAGKISTSNANNSSQSSRPFVAASRQQTGHNGQYATSILPSSSGSKSWSDVPFELKTSSGKAFIYFHSDTAQPMNGFYATYTVGSCPLDCSIDNGRCDQGTLTCDCFDGYYGDGCQYVSCPNNCTSPQHGVCDKSRSCLCNDGFYGADCSKKAEGNQLWVTQSDSNSNDGPPRPRSFHKAAIVNETMWILGGSTNLLGTTKFDIFKSRKTNIVSSFDFETKTWSSKKRIDGFTGLDHLAELSGHSIGVKDEKIYIYGGVAHNYTILDTLTVFDTATLSLHVIGSAKKNPPEMDKFVPPIASVGHSATIINDDMFVFFGYNNVFGYLHFVQKYSIARRNWSIVEQKGVSITGCIGHTTSYDPVTQLVYLFGGYNPSKSLTLYSFDPVTSVWRNLQSAPFPRYYHSAIIIERQLVILGGNTYNQSHQIDECFQQNTLTYDLDCRKITSADLAKENANVGCGRNCWHQIDEPQPGILKRQGLSVVKHYNELVLFGGFNGIMLNDLRLMKLGECKAISDEASCSKPRLGLKCFWNGVDSICENIHEVMFNSTAKTTGSNGQNCTREEAKSLQETCEARATCSDCLYTDVGCVWCASIPQCRYASCPFKYGESKYSNEHRQPTIDLDSCHRDDSIAKGPLVDVGSRGRQVKNFFEGHDTADVIDCRKTDNCFYCQAKPKCSWTIDVCSSNSPSNGLLPTGSLLPRANEELNDVYGNNGNYPIALPSSSNPEAIGRSIMDAIASGFLSKQTCESPCYLRQSCDECVSSKCIWCSSSEQCLESSAYFAYHQMGQCLHYVANVHMCPISTCSEIETCDKCLENPKCGWLNGVNDNGKGRCIEGTSSGPAFGTNSTASSNTLGNSTTQLITFDGLPNWYYSSCPQCQCNGHSHCKYNSSVCVQPCQDNTEGQFCERCKSGYHGYPVNGGTCRPCRCNGHAQTCHRETGKCFCSTKGIIGHHCQSCDDQNHYYGDPFESGNGTCYYNLTTDYQYTFNMSKQEDHSYSDINFMNIPGRWDSDVDFTIACSKLALVNISTGINYLTRKPLHSQLECGSFRLRLTPELSSPTGSMLYYYVHVHKFQTPFILQVAFSQHRAIFLPQVFFTFSSCFLFFFVLSGVLWKLKIEYDSYIRRQRQYIEMEQMASRPFSTIFLDLSKSSGRKASTQPAEPTPVSFEPCFGSNVGVLSLFVQLPGRPSLAIGSALVSLNEEDGNTNEAQAVNVRIQEKNQSNTSV